MNLHLERYYSSKLKPFGRLSKVPPMMSADHIDWVKRQNCVITNQPGADAHHVQFRSAGHNDYTAIPLRHDLHMRGHQEGFEKLESEYGVSFERALIAKLVERIWELECEIRGVR